MLSIGCHLSVAKRYRLMGEEALSIDANTFQFFSRNPRGSQMRALLAPSAFEEGNRLFTEFKGALSENYILQALLHQFETVPRYWTDCVNRQEVDFIIQRENDIFPIEVKSDENIESKSLKIYGEKFSAQTRLRLRYSMKNLKRDGNLVNIPLFMADYTDRIIQLLIK